MKEFTKKPTRRDLLGVISELQGLVGMASTMHGNDRNQNGFEIGQALLKTAHELCIIALSHDDPEVIDRTAKKITKYLQE